jgi:iron complex outermembrane receptor protein
MSDVGSYYAFSTSGFASLPRNFTALPSGVPATKINDHSFFINLEHAFNDAWKITGQVARFTYDQHGSSMWPSSVNPDGTWIRAVSSWDAHSTMSMAQVFLNGEATTGPIRHSVLTGLDVASKSYLADWGQYHVLDSVGAEFNALNPSLGTPVNGYPKFDYSSPLAERAGAVGGLIDQRYSAFYFQDELALLENKVRLTLAARYTNIEQSEFGGESQEAERITPRVGLSVSVDNHTSVYALYDQAFTPQAGRLSNGAEVKPILGTNQEIGLKRDWFAGRWNTTLSVYRIMKQHELTADPNSPPASGLSIELGEKRASGFEFDLRGSILPGLSMVSNYAYTDSKVTKVANGITDIEVGDVVPGYAKHTANTWLSYKLEKSFLKGTGFSLGFTYLSGRETYWNPSPDPDQVLPDYFKLDGGIFWENNKLRITANVFNILDAYLYSGSYYSRLQAYYWQVDPPRNFRLSLAYDF